MTLDSLHFYPGLGNSTSVPLARYLPPIPAGAVSGWLSENLPRGSWLLDPMGFSPTLALEAARAGYRVLVASNNPITSFVIETLARAPKPAEFQAAISALASVRRGEERLEAHIKNLYLTTCDSCGDHVPAQSFLWRKGETQPFARIYHCPKCGDSGEQPVIQADLERLAAMGGDKMQRSRALQRVIPNEDEHRQDVIEALECYLPRPLYVIFTLINKLEGLGLPPEQVRLLHALLISICDMGNTLWAWPGGRSRPKQLTTPPQFRENNLWMALEEAVDTWSESSPERVPVVRWPEQPPESGGISLYRGRVKSLMPLPAEIGPQAVLTAFPRPNQAYWTLSVLWAGWRWGPEAALPLRNGLDRRRYDWNWHTSAIHSALVAVSGSIPPETPFFGILAELAPGFLSAVVTAAEAAGFRLKHIALRPEQDLAQGLWSPMQSQPGEEARSTAEAGEEAQASPDALEKAAREAMQADLLERNEPAPYLVEYAAGLLALSQAGAIGRSLSNIPGDLLTRVQAILARTFAARSFLRLYGGQAEEERGSWWLVNPPARAAEPLSTPQSLPLADRVEIEVVRALQRNAEITFDDLDQALCELFPGLLTPPVELARACLDSYGEPVPSQSGSAGQRNWRIRGSEAAAARRTDLQEMREGIEKIGACLGYTTLERGSALIWQSKKTQEEAWWFFRLASSIVARYVLAHPPGPLERCVLVLPGSRARLLNFKIRRDPRLEEALQGWRILKFRHLREMAAGLGQCPVELDLAAWESLIDKDPLTDEATQMPLFSAG